VSAVGVCIMVEFVFYQLRKGVRDRGKEGPLSNESNVTFDFYNKCAKLC
jgi:hypothetical protein